MSSASDASQLHARQLSQLEQLQALEARVARLATAFARAANRGGTQQALSGDDREPTKFTSGKGSCAGVPAPAANAKSSKVAPVPNGVAAAAAAAVPANDRPLPSDDDPSLWWTVPDNDNTGCIPRLRAVAAREGFTKSRFYRIKEGGDAYYNWELSQRRDALGLPSINHLFKSVIMVNSRWDGVDPATQGEFLASPRYVLVLSGYAEKLNKEGLARALWEEHAAAVRRVHAAAAASTAAGGSSAPAQPLPTLLSKKAFNLRLAPEDVARDLTGYAHNGMTPLGLAQPQAMRMLLSASALGLEGGSLALGGGETDVKWRVSVPELVRIWKPLIADIASA